MCMQRAWCCAGRVMNLLRLLLGIILLLRAQPVFLSRSPANPHCCIMALPLQLLPAV